MQNHGHWETSIDGKNIYCSCCGAVPDNQNNPPDICSACDAAMKEGESNKGV